jgi:hypothetical protein
MICDFGSVLDGICDFGSVLGGICDFVSVLGEICYKNHKSILERQTIQWPKEK